MAKTAKKIETVSTEETIAMKENILSGYKMSLTKKMESVRKNDTSKLRVYLALGKELNKFKTDIKPFKLTEDTLEDYYKSCGIASSTARLARKLDDVRENIPEDSTFTEARLIAYPKRNPKPEDEKDDKDNSKGKGKEGPKKLTPEQHKIRALEHILKIDDKRILQDLIAQANKKMSEIK